jgi:hypothetical protein
MCNENHTQIMSKTLYSIVLQGIWKGGEDLNIQSLSAKIKRGKEDKFSVGIYLQLWYSRIIDVSLCN